MSNELLNLLTRKLKYITLALPLGFIPAGSSSAQEINAGTPWIWMGGDTTLSQPGLYGVKGATSLNTKPAARIQASSWTDTLGNFWLFGGRVYGSTVTQALRNDLWKFNPSTREWTWVSGDSTVNGPAVSGTIGVPSVNNTPSARSQACTWKDKSGNFWIMGGNKSPSSALRLNDLWRFNPLTNEWTLIAGNPLTTDTAGIYGTMGVPAATNRPGSRCWSASWTDNNGDLWLFGGQGQASTAAPVTGLSDLWKYNIATNTWTWMGGANVSSPAANFGTQGVAAASNMPGGRCSPVTWKDTLGNFWMMGGLGYVTTTQGLLNDLWKFNPSTQQWTWMQGSNVTGNPGKYISQGTASADRMPRSRMYATSWVDQSGNLWLFGGATATFLNNTLNDIWKFDIAANQWSWVKGDSTHNVSSVYNALGVPSAANEIGSRGVEISWREKKNNNVWIFGGHIPPYSTRNDLWKIQACAPVETVQAIAGPDTVCAGETVSYTVPAISSAFSYIWNVPSGWTGSSDNPQITLVAGNTGGTISVRVLGTCGDTSNIQVRNLGVEAPPVPVISQSGSGSAITLSVNGTYITYQWYLNGVLISGATFATYNAVENGSYTVKVNSARGCSGTSQPVNVSGITGINELRAEAGISLFPNPAQQELNIRCYTKILLRVIAIEGRILQEHQLAAGKHIIGIGNLAPGIYFAEFRTPEGLLIQTTKVEKQ